MKPKLSCRVLSKKGEASNDDVSKSLPEICIVLTTQLWHCPSNSNETRATSPNSRPNNVSVHLCSPFITPSWWPYALQFFEDTNCFARVSKTKDHFLFFRVFDFFNFVEFLLNFFFILPRLKYFFLKKASAWHAESIRYEFDIKIFCFCRAFSQNVYLTAFPFEFGFLS